MFYSYLNTTVTHWLSGCESEVYIDPKFVFLYFRDPSEMVRPRVAMSACFEAFAAPEVVDDFYSTALQAKSVAQKLVNLMD